METIDNLFGLYEDRLTLTQMLARGTFVFLTTLAVIRISGPRILGKKSAIDHLATLIIGAILGRVIIVGNQPFFESIATVMALVILHKGFAWISYRSQFAGRFFKGDLIILMENGILNKKNMRSAHITENDIRLALRTEMHIDDIEKIDKITLERSGEMSFILKI